MKNLLFLWLTLVSFPLFAQEYNYKVDLNAIEKDELAIELMLPALNKKELTFHMPAMVPGTYSVYNFGRFVYDFKVYDKDGNKLEWEHPDVNTWKILNAKAAAKITYKVEDTWDTEKPNVIFEPAGSNIDEDVFVFNNHGIFGYLDGFEKLPFRLEIDRPSNLYGGTAMERVGGDEDTDIFLTDSYNNLVDNPILFAEPDTAKIQIGKAEVLIHTYSPTGRVKSKELVADIMPILEAQRAYLGGTLPVDKYVFLIFLVEEGDSYLSGSAGALEHSYSSFYCLFEGEPSSISQTVRDVAAHEFFHIVTPLSIHSKEIHDFDFINPEMSKHLWLYEGATEYAAQHVQVKQGLVPLEQFLNTMSQKMRQADLFNQELAFTTLSELALDEHKSQYPNVYLKGALINMVLDMRLRSLSKGKYGIQNMMTDLAKKYGITKPFKDKCLFKDIGKVTGYRKEMKHFFSNYVAGAEALPITAYMAEMGIEYQTEGTVTELSQFGFDLNTGIGFNRERMLIELKADGIDPFGKDIIGFQGGDLLYKWQGQELNISTIQSVMGQHQMGSKEGDDLEVVVLRKNDAGEYEEMTLTGVLKKVPVTVKHVLLPKEDATPEQLALRKAWLGDYKTES
ncbi:MAG: peptidase M61 [Aureispira sp.]